MITSIGRRSQLTLRAEVLFCYSYFVEVFRGKICTVRPFYGNRSQCILNKLLFVTQRAKNLTF